MTLYSLLGRNGSTGTFDTSTGIAECRGKERLFNSGMVIEPGDTLVIKGEEFVVSNFRAVDFGSTVKRRTPFPFPIIFEVVSPPPTNQKGLPSFL